MNQKQLIRLAYILAGALALWGILAVTRRAPADAVATLRLPKVDTASVDSVTVTQRADTERLQRVAHGPWRVNGYPAASEAIGALLRGLADTTVWSEEVAESRASHARFGVGADSGARTQVWSHGRAILDLTTGRRTTDYTGLYVRRTDGDAVYALHGSLADGLGRPVSDWRDKRIVSVVADSVSTIAIQRGAQAYTLHRDGSSWRFGTGVKADSSAAATLLGQYRDLTAVGFASAAESDSVHFARAQRHVRLLRANGMPLVSMGFDSSAAHVWARADTGGPVFQLTGYMVSQLAPPDSTLKIKKAGR